jgi:UDP-2,3-diacylglucosamine hydrolase
VISDAHLGAAPKEVETEVIAFLRVLRERAGSVVINGDLFDFWFEWRSVIPRSSFRALAAIAELAEAGIPVLWIAGNHDCWGGEVLRQDVGADYHVGAWRGSIAGWSALIEHGDGLREVEDRRYRRLRTVIRHPWAIRAFRMLHPDLSSRIASQSSHASRKYQPLGPSDKGGGLRLIAAERLASDASLELVIFGHSHVPALARLRPGGIYANAGSWLDAPTYLRIDDERIALERWNGSAEGERLDALDRGAEEALP